MLIWFYLSDILINWKQKLKQGKRDNTGVRCFLCITFFDPSTAYVPLNTARSDFELSTEPRVMFRYCLVWSPIAHLPSNLIFKKAIAYLRIYFISFCLKYLTVMVKLSFLLKCWSGLWIFSFYCNSKLLQYRANCIFSSKIKSEGPFLFGFLSRKINATKI